jgi:hypothetical protein
VYKDSVVIYTVSNRRCACRSILAVEDMHAFIDVVVYSTGLSFSASTANNSRTLVTPTPGTVAAIALSDNQQFRHKILWHISIINNHYSAIIQVVLVISINLEVLP